MGQPSGIDRTADTGFTYASAHSTPIIVAIGALLLIETTVLHLWLHPTYPMVAWVLSASSIATLWWLILDHRRFLRGVVTMTDDGVVLAIGSRWCSAISRAQIVGLYRPSWRDLPDPLGSSAGFLSAMKPVEPNVVIRCDPPAARQGVWRDHQGLHVYWFAPRRTGRIHHGVEGAGRTGFP